MSDGQGNNSLSGQALQSYAALLGPAAPRIAAGYLAAPLPVLVEATLAELTAAGASFTAYDVTMILRALFAYKRPLPHYDRGAAPGVQPETHRQMAGYLAGGGYTTRIVRPNGVDQARLYTPVKRRRRGLGLVALTPITTATNGAGPLPVRAWVVQCGSS